VLDQLCQERVVGPLEELGSQDLGNIETNSNSSSNTVIKVVAKTVVVVAIVIVVVTQ